MMRSLKSMRVILAGDFNSTETKSSFDAGGSLPPSDGKEPNSEAIQTMVTKWGFKDLWTQESNLSREVERPNLDHLTHWNHDHTRGLRLDRIYANFEIKGTVNVSTAPHIGSDHKGVLLKCCNLPEAPGAPPPRPLPHRAFELKSVKEYNKAILTDYLENHLTGPNAYPKWDKAKRLMRTHAIEEWEKKVRSRGATLKKLTNRVARLERALHRLPVSNPYRHITVRNLDRPLGVVVPQWVTTQAAWVRFPRRAIFSRKKSPCGPKGSLLGASLNGVCFPIERGPAGQSLDTAKMSNHICSHIMWRSSLVDI
jgi:hypothetical protein